MRHIGQIGHNPVTRFDAHLLQRLHGRADLLAQLTPGQRVALDQFAVKDQGFTAGRVGLIGPGQQLLCVVESGAFKPYRAGHFAFAQNLFVRGGRLDIEPFPKSGPESLKVGHGPLPQRLIVGQVQPAGFSQPGSETGQFGVGQALRAGAPQRGAVCLVHLRRLALRAVAGPGRLSVRDGHKTDGIQNRRAQKRRAQGTPFQTYESDGLHRTDFAGLQTFTALGNFELDFLVLGEGFEPVALDLAEVGKEIFTAFTWRNKSEAFRLIEPLNDTGLRCHTYLPFP